MSAGERRTEAEEEGEEERRGQGEQWGLISDIPLCVVIPAPAPRPSPSLSLSLFLLPRWLSALSLSLSAPRKEKHCCSFIAIQFYTNLGVACPAEDGDFNQL